MNPEGFRTVRQSLDPSCGTILTPAVKALKQSSILLSSIHVRIHRQLPSSPLFRLVDTNSLGIEHGWQTVSPPWYLSDNGESMPANVGFGVWGLGFGVWGLGDRKS